MDSNIITVHTDGGSRGNPGPAAIGAIATLGNETLFTISEKIGEATNNIAEYLAVLRSLETINAKEYKAKTINFYLDSLLVVMQIKGSYKIKQPHLQELHQQILQLCQSLVAKGQVSLISFSHVPREQNKIADRLVNQALDS